MRDGPPGPAGSRIGLTVSPRADPSRTYAAGVRAALIVNPFATTTTDRVREVLMRTFGTDRSLDVEVMRTEGRGHATDLAARARRDGVDVVIALGGDGTVNEVANGILTDIDPVTPVPLDDLPLVAVIPGGSANVVARGLGIPADPVSAAEAVIAALHAGSTRDLGIGHLSWWDTVPEPVDLPESQRRWVVFSAGLGLDAEVIAAMEAERAAGRRATPARYAQITLRQWLRQNNRRHPGLVVTIPGEPLAEAFVVIVCFTSPWTYVGPVPIDPLPTASFDTGLDVMALGDLGMAAVSRIAGRMASGVGVAGLPGVRTAHDQPEITVRARRLTPLQVDGDLVGHIVGARIVSVPAALRVAVPPDAP